MVFASVSSPSTPAVAGSQPGWVQISPVPTPRGVIAAATDRDGNIYVVGGLGNDSQNFPLGTPKYSPSTKTWTLVASPPYFGSGMAAARGGDGLIYAFGGCTTGYEIASYIQQYDPQTGRWALMSNHYSTSPSQGPAIGSGGTEGLDGRIYVIGGAKEGYCWGDFGPGREIASGVLYDPTTDSVTWIPDMPTARAGLAVVTLANGNIFAIGGDVRTGSANLFQSVVESYDPSTNTWSTKAPMPTPRFGLAAAVGADGRIYAIGGYTYGGITDTVEIYDPSTDSWTTGPSLQTPRAYLAAAVDHGGNIYAIGGYYGSKYVGTVEELTTARASPTPTPTATTSPTQTVSPTATSTPNPQRSGFRYYLPSIFHDAAGW